MNNYEAKQVFVTFISPGTLSSESTTKEIASWDTIRAVEMAEEINERHGATPYGFYFTTKGRTASELDSRVIDRSGFYFMGGHIETLQEVRAQSAGREVLIANMETNGWNRVVTTKRGYSWAQPVHEDDAVLDMAWL